MGVPQVMSSLWCCLKLHCSQWIQMSFPLTVHVFSLWKQSQSGSKSPNLVLQTYQCEGLGYNHGVLNYSISHESWLVVFAGWVTQKEVSPTYKKEITRIGDLRASSHWGGNSRLFLWSHIAKTQLRCFHALRIRTICVLIPPDHSPCCGSPLTRRWSHDFLLPCHLNSPTWTHSSSSKFISVSQFPSGFQLNVPTYWPCYLLGPPISSPVSWD